MNTENKTPSGGNPVRVGVVLGQGDMESGPLRLLDHLTADARYEIAGLWQADHVPPAHPRLLAIESRLVPLPQVYKPQHWKPEPATALPSTPVICDLIVDFSHNALVLPLAQSAEFGLLRLSAYDEDSGVEAALAGDPATRVKMDHWDSSGQKTTLANAVYDTKFAAFRNVGYVREKSVQLIIHLLAQLHRDRALPVPEMLPVDEQKNVNFFGYGLRTAQELGSRIKEKVIVKSGGTPGGFGLRIGTGDVANFDPASGIDLPMPKRHFWADPFLLEHEGKVYCLFEDYDYERHLGHIGAGILTDDGMDYLGRAHVVPHHLSFPYIFKHGGDIWMMPETHQAKRLELWRATKFPLEWELHSTAFEGRGLADSVLFEHADDWWLLTGYCTDGFGDFCGELHLFRTSGLDMAWMEPHPLNPVVVGADTARLGGRIHKVGDRLLRVSQDNSGGIYGWGLNVMEIERLTRDDYVERRIRHITPDFAPGLVGCHHFDCAGGRWIMDVRRP
ncbi:MAG: hypothetical protein AB3N23_11020 [Paracoccaceae bacterium]